MGEQPNKRVFIPQPPTDGEKLAWHTAEVNSKHAIHLQEALTAAQQRVAELEAELADAESSVQLERQEYRETIERWKEFHNSLCIILGARFRVTSATLEEAKKLTADNARLRELLRECLCELEKFNDGGVDGSVVADRIKAAIGEGE